MEELTRLQKENEKLHFVLELIKDWPGSSYEELAMEEIVDFVTRVLEGEDITPLIEYYKANKVPPEIPVAESEL